MRMSPTAFSPPWRSILETGDSAVIEEVIHAITTDLIAALSETAVLRVDHAGSAYTALLATGLPGVALYFAEHARVLGDPTSRSLAIEQVGRALASARARALQPGLLTGLGGLAWLHKHVVRLGIADALVSPHHPLRQIRLAVESTHWPYGFDLVNGLAGIGIYVSGCQQDDGTSVLVASRLLDASTERDGMRYWVTTPSLLPAETRSDYPDGYADTGIAHGQAGAIIALAALRRTSPKAVPNPCPVEEGIRWLQSILTPVGTPERYTRRVNLRTGSKEPCGIGWCNGALSVSVAYLWAGSTFGRPEWTAAGVDLALSCARIDPATAGALDPGLCHGTAGISHTFARLFQHTGHPTLRRAARDWLMETLKFRVPGTPLAGFATHYRERYLGWPNGYRPYDLLTGLSGIGLGLLGAIANSPPSWDEVLCLDIPSAVTRV